MLLLLHGVFAAMEAKIVDPASTMSELVLLHELKKQLPSNNNEPNNSTLSRSSFFPCSNPNSSNSSSHSFHPQEQGHCCSSLHVLLGWGALIVYGRLAREELDVEEIGVLGRIGEELEGFEVGTRKKRQEPARRRRQWLLFGSDPRCLRPRDFSVASVPAISWPPPRFPGYLDLQYLLSFLRYRTSSLQFRGRHWCSEAEVIGRENEDEGS